MVIHETGLKGNFLNCGGKSTTNHGIAKCHSGVMVTRSLPFREEMTRFGSDRWTGFFFVQWFSKLGWSSREFAANPSVTLNHVSLVHAIKPVVSPPVYASKPSSATVHRNDSFIRVSFTVDREHYFHKMQPARIWKSVTLSRSIIDHLCIVTAITNS